MVLHVRIRIKDCAQLAPLMKLSLNQYNEFTTDDLQTRIHEWINIVKTLWKDQKNYAIVDWITPVESALIKICFCLSRGRGKGSLQVSETVKMMYEMYQTLILCCNFFVQKPQHMDKVKHVVKFLH